MHKNVLFVCFFLSCKKNTKPFTYIHAMKHLGKLRADNTFLIEGMYGDNPKLMGRLRTDGRVTLYLEYYMGKAQAVSRKTGHGYMRSLRCNEPLNIYIYNRPASRPERNHNRRMLDIARGLRLDRDRQIASGVKSPLHHDTDILRWMDDYYNAYTKSDHRHILRACRIFREFLTITPQLSHFSGVLRASQLTPALMSAFTDYLCRRFRGEGPHTLYARFKKMMRAAVEAGILAANPCDGVAIKTDTGVLRKEVLSDDEIARLTVTHCPGENTEVRRAFLFCLYAGLRWCDVTTLTYNNVDFSNRLLRFEQAKTRGRSTASAVVIPLTPTLAALIGKPPALSRDQRVFILPSRRATQSALRRWITAAGIDKHITWHCARHSFALRLLNHGANIKTVAALLGHSTIRHTEKYTRAVDSLKLAAVLSLPPLREL